MPLFIPWPWQTEPINQSNPHGSRLPLLISQLIIPGSHARGARVGSQVNSLSLSCISSISFVSVIHSTHSASLSTAQLAICYDILTSEGQWDLGTSTFHSVFDPFHLNSIFIEQS